MRYVLCIDVDGTLIRSIGRDANKLHKEGFHTACKEVFGVDIDVESLRHHGQTDPMILVKMCLAGGISKE